MKSYISLNIDRKDTLIRETKNGKSWLSFALVPKKISFQEGRIAVMYPIREEETVFEEHDDVLFELGKHTRKISTVFYFDDLNFEAFKKLETTKDATRKNIELVINAIKKYKDKKRPKKL